MIDVLVINLNCLGHTQNLVDDLRRQMFKEFQLTLVDQNSVEGGTDEYLNSLAEDKWVKVVRNSSNVSIHRLWNNFVSDSTKPYIALLNNDIRIPSNFLLDNARILDAHESVGVVVHPTNHPNYSKTLPNLSYEILPSGYRQGWDMCIRRVYWTKIPEELVLYCGDGYIHESMYMRGYKLAMALSSPIVHYQGETINSKHNTHVHTDWSLDFDRYRSMGFIPGRLKAHGKYSIVQFKNSSVEYIREVHDERNYN